MAEPTPNPNPNPNPPPDKPPAPPQTPDVVNDNHAKSIRAMEEKLAASEKTTQDLKAELKSLEEIVKKAGEVKTPVVIEQKGTLLSWVNDLIWPPSTPPAPPTK